MRGLLLNWWITVEIIPVDNRRNLKKTPLIQYITDESRYRRSMSTRSSSKVIMPHSLVEYPSYRPLTATLNASRYCIVCPNSCSVLNTPLRYCDIDR